MRCGRFRSRRVPLHEAFAGTVRAVGRTDRISHSLGPSCDAVPPAVGFGGATAGVARAGDRVALLLAILAVALGARVAWMHGGGTHATAVGQRVAAADPTRPRGDEIVLSRPPRSAGLAAVAVRLAGRADWESRLPSVVGAFASAVGTFVCGLALLDPRRAWFAVGAALSMLVFWLPPTDVRLDVAFAACTVIGLVAFRWWHRDRGASARAVHVASALARPGLVAAGIVIGWGALAGVRDVRDLVAMPIVRDRLSRTVALDSSAGHAAHAAELVRISGVQGRP